MTEESNPPEYDRDHSLDFPLNKRRIYYGTPEPDLDRVAAGGTAHPGLEAPETTTKIVPNRSRLVINVI